MVSTLILNKIFMNRSLRNVFIIITAIFIIGPYLSGCTAPCEYPDQRGVKIRILNAMPDMPAITVFIDGKKFVENYSYDPPPGFGYLSIYTDGTPLSAGDSELFVATSDAAGKDTLVSERIPINFNRQTVIVMGRGHFKFPQKKTSRIIRLDDQIDQPSPTQTLIRFVNAVPDLDSLDIYTDSVGLPLGTPVATIHYAEVLPHMILNSVKGLTITEAGHPNNVILTIPYPFAFPGFFITAVVRGESKPIGTDHTAAPLVLSDASIGNYIFNFNTFAVRLVNTSRSLTLSLLIRSTYVTLNNENTNPPRNNYPNQSKVLNINAGVISEYIPLNISGDSIAGYWLSTTKDDSSGTVASSVDNSKSNIRYSKIAVEETPLNQSGTKISYMSLPDTMTNPAGNFARVRVIHLSPDHANIDITIGGKTVTMHKRDVMFFDVPLSDTNITLKDGGTTKNYTIPISPITPVSVYLLPDKTGSQLPIATSDD